MVEKKQRLERVIAINRMILLVLTPTIGLICWIARNQYLLAMIIIISSVSLFAGLKYENALSDSARNVSKQRT